MSSPRALGSASFRDTTHSSSQQQHDESGNLVFLDVGAWLKAELGAW
jgi:hypothetical protein